MYFKTSSAISPCGSMMHNPLPRSMSDMAMFSSRVDFPVPDLPMT